MTLPARFVHCNLVARDWRRLAEFYEQVLGCVRAGPERDLAGEGIDAGTGMPGTRIRGVHLRLPGSAATLEIFQYEPPGEGSERTMHRPGFGHIAFAVPDVAAARDDALTAGGGAVGDVVTVEVPGAGSVTFAYVTDPEGNVIELQRWA